MGKRSGILPAGNTCQQNQQHYLIRVLDVSGPAKLHYLVESKSYQCYESENGELFAEVDEIKYRKHHYSGVNLPDYWEPYTETVSYRITVNENELYFEKVQKTA